MSTAVRWTDLAILTLRAPKDAAAVIIGWQLPQSVLWMAAVLITILSTFMSILSNALMPVPEVMAVVLAQPLILCALTMVVFVLGLYVLVWAGRALGGGGEVDEMLALLVWLQLLRALAGLVALLSVVLLPPLAGLLIFAVGIATIWILLNFVSVGLQLNSLMSALLVLLITGFAISFGLAMLLQMLGVSAFGVPPNV
ncbi:YIP1 family protein [uncultured Roseobacter sp.]|uniref:YIP1 family protein n=1 Tax=uncultured Roseobacter sp. TaxID=114847 RepID=UPI00261AE5A2|nr:YIP1 family protein [uncultured Roseobacter sp.]